MLTKIYDQIRAHAYKMGSATSPDYTHRIETYRHNGLQYRVLLKARPHHRDRVIKIFGRVVGQ